MNDTATKAGELLAQARRQGRKLAGYPCDKPADLAQAHAIQDAMAGAMGQPVVGWKVGLTSDKAQELCGYGAPLAGPVFDGGLFGDGAELALAEGDLGVLEAEIGLRMMGDLPPRDAPYERAEVMAAIGAVLPVIEWVNKRLPGGLLEAPEWLVADGVINRAVICGAAVPYAPDMDLARETVSVRVAGQEVTRGQGAVAMGGPIEVLTWLANDLSARGKGLREGDIVATGLIADVVQAVAGLTMEARFATLGAVSLRVS